MATEDPSIFRFNDDFVKSLKTTLKMRGGFESMLDIQKLVPKPQLNELHLHWALIYPEEKRASGVKSLFCDDHRAVRPYVFKFPMKRGACLLTVISSLFSLFLFILRQ